MEKTLRESTGRMKEWLVELRRKIHMNPELGFEEFETSKLIAEELRDLGLEVREGVAKTGVVALLRGKGGGKTVAIRADMDAIALDELTQAPYASRTPGKMHACGHDAHVAIALGVAKFFSEIRENMKGNIKFLFQPAEEGGGGGRLMVEEGALEDPKVDAIFGAHVLVVDPLVPIGRIGIYEREGFAAADKFRIRIIGEAGHGSSPYLARDPILAAGHVITEIHSIVGRNVPPWDIGVISIGKVSGGTAFNNIPGEVEMLGTVRSLVPEVREKLRARIENVVRGTAEAFEMEYKFEYEYGYPVLLNDPKMSSLVASACAKGIGSENVKVLKPTVAGDDFAYYLEKVPGAYFRLGVRNEEKGIVHINHSPLFDIDEDVLPLGVELFVRIVDQYLDLGLKLDER